MSEEEVALYKKLLIESIKRERENAEAYLKLLEQTQKE